MKRLIWLVMGLMATVWVAPAQAQFVLPGYGQGYGKVFGLRYKSGHLSIGGFAYQSFSSGAYLVNPVVPVTPYYPYPYGGVSSRVTVNIYNPPPIVVAPAQDYDLRGVDLDLVKPEKVFGPGVKEPDQEPPPPPPKPEPPPPGKDVSVPKKAVRPEDAPPALQPKVQPPAPGNFPKPGGPLPDAGDESDRLVALGLEAFKEKTYGTAAQLFKKAAQVDPSNFLAYLLLTQAQVAFPRLEQALAAIHSAMKLKKDEYPNIKFRPRSSLYKGMEGDFDTHLEQLKEAVKAAPKSPELLFLLAHQLWFDDQRDAALELFVKARPFTVDPTYIDLFLNAGKPKIVAAK